MPVSVDRTGTRPAGRAQRGVGGSRHVIDGVEQVGTKPMPRTVPDVPGARPVNLSLRIAVLDSPLSEVEIASRLPPRASRSSRAGGSLRRTQEQDPQGD